MKLNFESSRKRVRGKRGEEAAYIKENLPEKMEDKIVIIKNPKDQFHPAAIIEGHYSINEYPHLKVDEYEYADRTYYFDVTGFKNDNERGEFIKLHCSSGRCKSSRDGESIHLRFRPFGISLTGERKEWD